MFREMRRKKQQLEESDCVEILKNEKRGVLSVIGDDGRKYISQATERRPVSADKYI